MCWTGARECQHCRAWESTGTLYPCPVSRRSNALCPQPPTAQMGHRVVEPLGRQCPRCHRLPSTLDPALYGANPLNVQTPNQPIRDPLAYRHTQPAPSNAQPRNQLIGRAIPPPQTSAQPQLRMPHGVLITTPVQEGLMPFWPSEGRTPNPETEPAMPQVEPTPTPTPRTAGWPSRSPSPGPSRPPSQGTPGVVYDPEGERIEGVAPAGLQTLEDRQRQFREGEHKRAPSISSESITSTWSDVKHVYEWSKKTQK